MKLNLMYYNIMRSYRKKLKLEIEPEISEETLVNRAHAL